MRRLQFIAPLLYLLICTAPVNGQDAATAETQYKTDKNILYRDGELDDYAKRRCRLDVYYPTQDSAKPFPTVVWFHGGGLKAGSKKIPEALKNKKIGVVAVNYRLHPKVKSPTYVEDAAAAVAWTFNNIQEYGGSPDLIFVSGHSAGGYLTSMIGVNKRWLAAHDIDANRIAGLIPYSGHTITHFTVRAERGIDGKQPLLDDMAPLFHVRADAPPTLFITGDRELEMLGRYEENAYMWRMMKVAGHEQSELMELDGFNHGAMGQPAHTLMLNFVRRIAKSR